MILLPFSRRRCGCGLHGVKVLARSPFFGGGKQILAPLQTHRNSKEQGGEYEALQKDDQRWWEEEDVEEDVQKSSQTRENRNWGKRVPIS